MPSLRCQGVTARFRGLEAEREIAPAFLGPALPAPAPIQASRLAGPEWLAEVQVEAISWKDIR